MSDREPATGRWPAISECEICSRLGSIERSFSKYGWDEMDESLPAEAAQLVPAEPTEGYDRERHHVKRCPLCGTFYRYDQSYEYLVNGSEDEEELERLTPAQARRFLSDEEYAALMGRMRGWLRHASGQTRAFAAGALAAEALARGEPAGAVQLLRDEDPEVVRGVLWMLVREVEPAGLAGLEGELAALAGSADEEIRGRAAYLLRQAERG